MRTIYYILLICIFIGCNNSEQRKVTTTSNPIYGKWIVVNASVEPFEHISYCKKLYVNSVFEFEQNKRLNVYDKLNGEICTKDQVYKIVGEELSILEWDMVFAYDIRKLTSDTLIFTIERIPSYFWDNANLNDSIIHKNIKHIEENGITITLKKIEDN